MSLERRLEKLESYKSKSLMLVYQYNFKEDSKEAMKKALDSYVNTNGSSKDVKLFLGICNYAMQANEEYSIFEC